MNPMPIDDLLAAVAATTGLRFARTGNGLAVRVTRPGATATRVDLLLADNIDAAQVSRHVDRVQRAQQGHPVVLAATHVTANAAAALRERGVQFVDAAGNAFLDLPTALIWVTGHRRTPDPLRPLSGPGPSAWQVAFVLLRGTEGAVSVRELGARAGVSHGSAATALRVFEERGWVRTLRRSTVEVVDFDGFFDGWLAGFGDRLAARLTVARATPGDRTAVRDWALHAKIPFSSDTGLLGGDVAAERLGCNIAGIEPTVHVRVWDAATMRHLRLLPSPRGSVVVRQLFAADAADPKMPDVVDALLVAGEVGLMPDRRLDDTRAQLRADLRRRWDARG